MYWEPTLAKYPLSLVEDDLDVCHARLTPAGKRKVHMLSADLKPGADYVVKEGGTDWLPFPKLASTKHFRDTWVLVRRRRPKVPTFFGELVPKHSSGEHQRAAAIIMSYFHPWTLRKNDDDGHVKYAAVVRKKDQTWQDALQQWLEGHVLCNESKKYISNFLAVHRMRPQDDESDDDNSQYIVSDEELEISRASLAEALSTRIGGKEDGGANTTEAGPTHFQNAFSAIS